MSLMDSLVADKIKRNQEKRQSEAIFDIIQQKIAQDQKSQGKSEEEILAFSDKIDKVTKAGFTPTEAVQIGKMIAPEVFNTKPPAGVYSLGQDGTLKQAGTVPGGSKVFKENLSAEDMGARALASREAVTENPQLDIQTQGAIAALDFINPRIDSALQILDEIGPEKFEDLVTQIQIGSKQELIVPNGSPLEDLVAEINDVKITGFGIAGSAYSGNEREVVEGGLNPIGKGFKRFKRDLMRNKDFFTARAKAGTMGLKEARGRVANSDTYTAGADKDKKSGSPSKTSPPKYDPKTQKLQKNSKGQYRVVPK